MTIPPDPQNPGSPDPSQGPGNYPGSTPEPGGSYPPPGGSYPPPGGSYPPPGGSYPPPPPGSYPPPGAYPPPPSGAFPPPGSTPPPPGAYPPPPQYGQPAFGQQPAFGGAPTAQFSVGDAISYGWERYKANALPWILVILVGVVAAAVVQWLGSLLGGGSVDSLDGGIGSGSFIISFIFGILAAIVGWFFQAAYARGALDEVSGKKPQFGDFFAFNNYGAILGTAALVAIGTYIGLILLIIPGIVFAFLAYWAMTFVVDRQQDPITAIKSSFSVISKNACQLLLLALVNVLLLILGAVLCLVGLLVTGPIVAIASTYAYRFFTGGPIAPLGAVAPGAFGGPGGFPPPGPPQGPPPGQYPPQ